LFIGQQKLNCWKCCISFHNPSTCILTNWKPCFRIFLLICIWG